MIVSSGRKLKRVLADEQNDVLDRLRDKKAVRSIDDLLPAADEQVARYFDALVGDLGAAGVAGAASIGGPAAEPLPDDDAVLGPIRTALAGDLVEPLRDRLGAGIDAVDGDNEDLTKKARAIYREWKTRRIDDHLDDLLRHAYGRGAFAALCGRAARPLGVRSGGRRLLGVRGQLPARRGPRRHGVPDRPHVSAGPLRVPLPRRPCRLTRPSRCTSSAAVSRAELSSHSWNPGEMVDRITSGALQPLPVRGWLPSQ